VGSGYVAIGEPVPRIDGRAKVTGQSRYAAEIALQGLVHGVVVNAAIARGRIVALHDEDARAVPGVLDVLWHGHRPEASATRALLRDGRGLLHRTRQAAGRRQGALRGPAGGAGAGGELGSGALRGRVGAGGVEVEAHETDLRRHHADGRVPKELDDDTAPPEPPRRCRCGFRRWRP
jgi:xanthine dehydrogenase YagR molybdenum-binding subunit